MNDQHLTVAVGTCPYTDSRYRNRLCHFLRQYRRYLLQNNSKYSGLFQSLCILYKLFGLTFLFCAHFISSEFINTLWRQPQVPHYRNSRIHNPLYRLRNTHAPLDLDGMGARLFHHASGVCQSLPGRHLIGHEWQICNDQCSFHRSDHRSSMVDHMVECHWNSCLVTRHNIAAESPTRITSVPAWSIIPAMV